MPYILEKDFDSAPIDWLLMDKIECMLNHALVLECESEPELSEFVRNEARAIATDFDSGATVLCLSRLKK
jgi:hypothetical protein